MRHNIFSTRTLLGIITFLVLQACYVQKNSETHATVIYEEGRAEDKIDLDAPEYSNDMITVAEHHEPKVSLEALSASIILIDIQKQSVSPRWEDDINFGYTRRNTQPFIEDEREEIRPVIINSY